MPDEMTRRPAPGDVWRRRRDGREIEVVSVGTSRIQVLAERRSTNSLATFLRDYDFVVDLPTRDAERAALHERWAQQRRIARER